LASLSLFRVVVALRHRIDAFAYSNRLEATNLTPAFPEHYKQERFGKEFITL